jgi:MFS family permease
LAVFALASGLGGLVNDGNLLIAARMIKGVAAAFTAPAALSILTTTFSEGAARNKALGAYAASGAGGFSLGLVIGGLLSELGWRWVFLVPAPFAVIFAVAGFRLLDPQEEPRTERRHYDLLGAVTVTGSMLLLVYSVVEAPTRGWGDATTLGGLALSAALLCAFVVVESRSKAPLIRLSILRNLPLVSADVGGMLFFGSYIGFQFLATLYVQEIAGWSPIQTALAFLPSGFFLPILGAQAERLIGRFGTARLIAAGLVAFGIGYALFWHNQGTDPWYISAVLPTMLVLGLGWGLGFPALNVQATSGVADEEQGLASGLFNTSIQIASAIVLAVVSAVITAHTTRSGGQAQGVLAASHTVLVILIPLAGVGALGMAAIGLRRPRSRALETMQDVEVHGAEV